MSIFGEISDSIRSRDLIADLLSTLFKAIREITTESSGHLNNTGLASLGPRR